MATPKNLASAAETTTGQTDKFQSTGDAKTQIIDTSAKGPQELTKEFNINGKVQISDDQRIDLSSLIDDGT